MHALHHAQRVRRRRPGRHEPRAASRRAPQWPQARRQDLPRQRQHERQPRRRSGQWREPSPNRACNSMRPRSASTSWPFWRPRSRPPPRARPPARLRPQLLWPVRACNRWRPRWSACARRPRPRPTRCCNCASSWRSTVLSATSPHRGRWPCSAWLRCWRRCWLGWAGACASNLRRRAMPAIGGSVPPHRRRQPWLRRLRLNSSPRKRPLRSACPRRPRLGPTASIHAAAKSMC